MRLAKRLSIVVVAMSIGMATFAQKGGRTVLSPDVNVGVSLNFDINDPAFSASLRLMADVGTPDDFLGFNVGVGYRGLFDFNPPAQFIYNRSFSDWLLYSSNDRYNREARPMGGQLILPAEARINTFNLGEDTRLYVGCGFEYGIRVYQSQRYGDYYGAHVMNATSIAFYPQIGVHYDDDDMRLDLSLYMRRYVRNCFNSSELDIKKFNGRDYFGLQMSICM